jgi:hypothetical protein
VDKLREFGRKLFGESGKEPESDAAGDLVFLAQADGQPIADMWRDMLAQRGIHSVIKSEVSQLHAPVGQQRVFVRRSDLEEARATLGLDGDEASPAG